MENVVQRFIDNFFGRMDGQLHFRFILQPLMAVIWAIIDGLKDAKAGKPAYFWTILTVPEHRKELMHDCWKHVGKIFILAVIIDIVYQLKVQHRIYPGELLIVAFVLAIVPYVLLRGPANRIARAVTNKKEGGNVK